jgi:hypothetical protein
MENRNKTFRGLEELQKQLFQGREVERRQKELVCKALAFAVVAIRSLPPHWQPGCDALDMTLLLNKLTCDVDYYLENARSRLEQGPAAFAGDGK